MSDDNNFCMYVYGHLWKDLCDFIRPEKYKIYPNPITTSARKKHNVHME